MTDYDMKDSGDRQEFETGAVRDTQAGKGRFDLIPVVALSRLAKVYQKGAEKYDARNWEQGINVSRFYDSALRHLTQYAEGHRDEDHLAQAAFNVFGMIHTEEMVNRGLLPESLSDLQDYTGMEDLPPMNDDDMFLSVDGLVHVCKFCRLTGCGDGLLEECPRYRNDT